MKRSNINHDETKKIVFVGLEASGKTSVLSNFTKNCFNPIHETTIQVKTEKKDLTVDNKQFNFQIWDTAGAKRFQAINGFYFQDAHLIILFIDLQRISESIADIDSQKFHKNINEKTKFAVIFTKSDLIEKQKFPSREALGHCVQAAFNTAKISEKQILTKMYFVTSAKNSTGIEEAFQHWGECLIPTIVPKLVLSTPPKTGGIFSSLFGTSSESESEDDDNEPLVSTFTF